MEPVWNVVITFEEDERTTRASATLELSDRASRGWGQSRRDPGDADIPRVGEEVAAARALIRLGHHLLGAAENEIEDIEHHPVHIHV